MKKVLITGASGFVGTHLISYIQKLGLEIWGTARVPHLLLHRDSSVYWENLDLINVESVRAVLQKVRPDVIFHLAGQSNVRISWDNKADTFGANVIGTIHLLDAVKDICPDARVLTVGSSEEYGIVAANEIPIVETVRPNPQNPYGVSKLTVGIMAQQYARSSGLNVIHVRPFNHIGPGQSLGFVTTDFTKQIVSIEMGLQSNELFVGNLEASRDFSDVRDIVHAYWEVATNGKVGEIYNVCSGHGVKISTILEELARRSQVEIKIIQDPTKFRAIDIPYYVGDNKKIKEDCGWTPSIPLPQTLDDILEDWRNRLYNLEGRETSDIENKGALSLPTNA